MEEAGVAERKDTPVWMDRSGDKVTEMDSLGCKVTHKLLRPDMCLVGNEVGGNINILGDGQVGGQLMLREKGLIPQQKYQPVINTSL